LQYPLSIAKLYLAMTLENEPKERVHKLLAVFAETVLATLYERPLVHIARLGWQSPYNVYIGCNLTAGISPVPYEFKNDKPVYHNYVYLHWVANNEFILLYPFFVYDEESAVLYRYSELSEEKETILTCPYDVPTGVKSSLFLKIDPTLTLGSSIQSSRYKARQRLLTRQTDPLTNETNQG